MSAFIHALLIMLTILTKSKVHRQLLHATCPRCAETPGCPHRRRRPHRRRISPARLRWRSAQSGPGSRRIPSGACSGSFQMIRTGRRSDARCTSVHAGESCSGPWAADGLRLAVPVPPLPLCWRCHVPPFYRASTGRHNAVAHAAWSRVQPANPTWSRQSPLVPCRCGPPSARRAPVAATGAGDRRQGPEQAGQGHCPLGTSVSLHTTRRQYQPHLSHLPR